MAVGEYTLPRLLPVPGVRLGVAGAAIKKAGRNDVTLIAAEPGSRVAGVFTRNAFCAEPVKIAREHLKKGNPRVLLINAGNANACTGQPGYQAAMRTCEALAEHLKVEMTAVLPFSTGVIGELLPADKIVKVLPALIDSLSEDNWASAARAIMTTDTRPKGASTQIELDGKTVTITGIAKGAGMINPNMGTLLCYFATDASVSQAALDQLAQVAADKSFNRITIDGDTSTNDSCMLIASGQAGNSEVEPGSDDCQRLYDGVVSLYRQLAREVVRDAEGATKFVAVNVRGGRSEQECTDVAYAIAHSPLIKTAVFAADPNWGRIICAIGYAGVENLDVAKVRVWLNDTLIVSDGGRAQSYTEEQGQAVLDLDEFDINVDLGRGQCEDYLWTSDLSHEYVKINAEYRT